LCLLINTIAERLLIPLMIITSESVLSRSS
jgi:hypothetical protein